MPKKKTPSTRFRITVEDLDQNKKIETTITREMHEKEETYKFKIEFIPAAKRDEIGTHIGLHNMIIDAIRKQLEG
jgi:hypothetical protein